MRETNNLFAIKTPEVFDLELSLDCGQAFRWKKQPDGSFCGVTAKRVWSLTQQGDELVVSVNGGEECKAEIADYFDFGTDYSAIIERLSHDSYLEMACREFRGIRILKQDSWEALCSFIISQNNNIPRIKGIIDRLCENFGEKIVDGVYSFPTAETLSQLTVEELAPLRAGFRAKYIIDAANKVADGQIDFDKIRYGTLDEGREQLLKIKGVGNKVADCTMLYGFARLDAFPVDVWVKRIVCELYPGGLPECMYGYHGVAQQYLFHWRRNSNFFAK